MKSSFIFATLICRSFAQRVKDGRCAKFEHLLFVGGRLTSKTWEVCMPKCGKGYKKSGMKWKREKYGLAGQPDLNWPVVFEQVFKPFCGDLFSMSSKPKWTCLYIHLWKCDICSRQNLFILYKFLYEGLSRGLALIHASKWFP